MSEEKVKDGPVIIKKYANRRLYNTQTSSYVTLDHLAGMVKDGIEFTVQTVWESLEAVRAFAGDTVDAAVVAPAAKPLFREFDSFVTHYEIVLRS